MTSEKVAVSSAEELVLQAEKLAESKKFSNAKELYTKAAELVLPFTGQRAKCMKWIKRAEELKAKEARTEARKFTSREIEILHKNSTINGKLYLPWDATDSVDMDSDEFLDSDGKLELSNLQKKDFSSWQRPGQLFGSSARMIHQISSESIVQNRVTNCSFVASLCICANYEMRMGKQLITAAIFPQDRQGQPMISKSGKYIVKLHCNGISRKVVIDDFLPTSADGGLLCTHSIDKGELWVSLMEKAFMKLSGGYSFLGSNSSVDLHTLTGWIPEQAYFSNDSNQHWRRLLEGYEKGFLLATIGTGGATEDLSPGKGRLGLVPSHAYAILDVKSTLGLKLMKLKNPWGRYRWKGAYSNLDLVRWTPELKKALDYDPLKATDADDGIFWIDYDSASEAFETLNFNWNPDYFPNTHVIHDEWELRSTPQLDTVSFGDNPQFYLEVEGPAVTWILLTRHTTTTVENQTYLATHLYQVDSGLERIFAHATPKIKGTYVNSTHLLTRFLAPAGLSRYTLVLSQQGAHTEISFTLRVFSMAPFRLDKMEYLKHEHHISASWNLSSSGGNISSPGFFQNSQFRLSVSGSSLLKQRCILSLTSTRSIPIGLVVFRGQLPINRVSKDDLVHTTSVYNLGSSIASLHIPAGNYIVIPTTHQPGEGSDYTLKVVGDNEIRLQSVRREASGMLLTTLDESWVPKQESMVVFDFILAMERTTSIKIRIRPKDPYIGKVPVALSISNCSETLVTSGAPSLTPQGAIVEHLFEIRRPPGGTRASLSAIKPTEYIVKATGWVQGSVDFSVVIYHDQPIKFSASPSCH